MSTSAAHINQLDNETARWFAVYTKFKREKTVAAQLRKQGIEVYVPLKQVTRRYTRKIKTHEIPMISCYIFVKIVKDEYLRVLKTQDVVKFVRFSKDLIAIPDREMNVMKRVVGELQDVEFEPSQYVLGEAVEIISGELTGLRGTLVKRHSKKKFLVALDHVGYSLVFEVDHHVLRKLHASLAL